MVYIEFSKFSQIIEFESFGGETEWLLRMKTWNAIEMTHNCNTIATKYNFRLEWMGSEELTKLRKYQPTIAPHLLENIPNTNSPLNIANALNDDCLFELFNVPSLDARDFIELGNVCKTFNRVISSVFRTRNLPMDRDIARELWKAEELYRGLADGLTTISLVQFYGERTDIRLRMVADHCTRLTNLHCDLFNKQTIMPIRRRLLPKLRKLIIIYRCERFADLFDSNVIYPLEYLDVDCLKPLLPEIKLPKLTNFSLAIENNAQLFNNFTFFEQNPQITTLQLRHCYFKRGVDQLMGYLPNLEAIELIDSYAHKKMANIQMSNFRRLRRLKKLEIASNDSGRWDSDIQSIEMILKALDFGAVQLEHLSIQRIQQAKHLCNSIRQLKSLRRLYYDAFISNDELLELIVELDELKSIHVGPIESIYGVRDALSRANNLETATFEIIFSSVENAILNDEIAAEIAALQREKNIRLSVVINVMKDLKRAYFYNQVSGGSLYFFFKLFFWFLMLYFYHRCLGKYAIEEFS